MEGRDGGARAVRAVRTVEIAVGAASDEALVYTSAEAGDTSWPAEAGPDSEPCAPGAAPCAPGADSVGFDLELAAQLPFFPLEAGARRVLEALGEVIAARSGDAAWIQAAFADRTEELAPVVARMGKEAERAARRGGAHADIAARMAEACAARAHERHVAVSIRGVVSSQSAKACIDALSAAAATVRFGPDSLQAFAYEGNGVARWMAARDLAHESSFGIIRENCRMWRNPPRTMRWGAGRDMSPVIVLSPAELAALVGVPRAGSLPVRSRRARPVAAAEVVEGFDLA